MRILVANPNTSVSVTDRLCAVGRAAAAAGTELVASTAPRGVPYISSRAEAQIAGAVLLETLVEQESGVDAAIIAAFGDPGLGGARELLDIPVVGYAEAAMASALMLGRRFAVVTFAQSMEAWYTETVEAYGLTSRATRVRCADRAFADLDAVQTEMEDYLVELALSAVNDDGADVIILGGAPLAGMARTVRHRIPVPCIDAMVAAVKQAEALVALAPLKATSGSFRRPLAKPSSGLAAPLAARIAGK